MKLPETNLRKLYKQCCIRSMVLIVAVMATMGVFSFVLPKPAESLVEKRKLAEMPAFSLNALFSGTYLRDFEAFYADTFPFRDAFIEMGSWFDELKGIRGSDDVKIYAPPTDSQPQSSSSQGASQPVSQPQGDPDGSGSSVPAVTPDDGSSSHPSNASSQPEQSSSQSDSSSQGSSAAPEVPDGYSSNGYFVVGDTGYMLFGGYRPVAEQYAGYLTQFARSLEGQAKVYNIVVPTSSDFYLPEKYQSLSNSQKDNISYLYSLYPQQNSPVITVDAYSNLERNKDQYIYFRTDHHWTARGAYCAYEAFCQTAGLTPVSLDSFEKRTIPDFLGTVYSYTRDQKLAANPDYVDYYITAKNYEGQVVTKDQPGVWQPISPWAEWVEGGNAYSVFLWGDHPVFLLDNLDIEDGNNVLVLKESYGNAFSPFLMANFDKTYVIDYRHYEQSIYDFVLEHNIKTVIFINNAFAANTSYHAERINYLANQLPHTAGVSAAGEGQDQSGQE